MSGKLIFGGLMAAGLMALSADTASAQFYGGHPGHRGVYSVPVYAPPRPVIVQPGFGYGYGYPVYSRPVVVSPGFGYGGFGNPYWGGGFGGPVYGGGFNSVNIGFGRPGFGVNVGFGNFWR
jgi:hypothetical protein